MYVTCVNRWDLFSSLFRRLSACIRFSLFTFFWWRNGSVIPYKARAYHRIFSLRFTFLFSSLRLSFVKAYRTGQDGMHIYIFRMSIQPLSFCHLFSFLICTRHHHLSFISPCIPPSLPLPCSSRFSCSHIPALPPSSASSLS